MMRAFTCAVLGVLVFGATGCAAVYTNIEKQEDGSYLVTRTKQGPFKTYGSLFKCAPNGDTMNCQEIAQP